MIRTTLLAASLAALAPVAIDDDGQDLTALSMRELSDLIVRARGLLEHRLLGPPGAEIEPDSSVGYEGAGRLLERDVLDDEGILAVRGDGAYYSFTTGTNDYDVSPDIGSSNGRLTSGFAGLDEGYVLDLGEVDLLELSDWSPSQLASLPEERHVAAELLSGDTIDIRTREGQREIAAELAELGFEPWAEVHAGHTYLVRSYQRGWSDLLVGLRVDEVGARGIAFHWKLLESWEVERANPYRPAPRPPAAALAAEAPSWLHALDDDALIDWLRGARALATERLLQPKPELREALAALLRGDGAGLFRMSPSTWSGHLVSGAGGASSYSIHDRRLARRRGGYLWLEQASEDRFDIGVSEGFARRLDDADLASLDLDAISEAADDPVEQGILTLFFEPLSSTDYAASKREWSELQSEGRTLGLRAHETLAAVPAHTGIGHTFLVRCVELGEYDFTAVVQLVGTDEWGFDLAYKILEQRPVAPR